MGSHQAYLSRPMLLWPNQLLRPSIILPRTGQSSEIPWLALSLCSIDPLWYPGKFVWFLCWIMWLFCNYVFFYIIVRLRLRNLTWDLCVVKRILLPLSLQSSNFFRFPALPSSFWSLSIWWLCQLSWSRIYFPAIRYEVTVVCWRRKEKMTKVFSIVFSSIYYRHEIT
jgi:hypothetical protein